MNAAFVSGFLLSFSLILAIGPQNAFVLRQGLLRQHVFPIAVFCATSDIILILLGIFGFGTIISDFDGFSQYMFIIGGFWLSGYGILRLKGAYVADSFLEEGLRPWLLEEACKDTDINLKLRMQPYYDHSYYFISTFMADHLEWHKERI